MWLVSRTRVTWNFLSDSIVSHFRSVLFRSRELDKVVVAPRVYAGSYQQLRHLIDVLTAEIVTFSFVFLHDIYARTSSFDIP